MRPEEWVCNLLSDQLEFELEAGPLATGWWQDENGGDGGGINDNNCQ